MDLLAPRLPEASLEAMPLFPLPATVFVPATRLPLNVFEPRYRDLVEYALGVGQGAVAVPLLRPGFEAHYEGRPAVYPIMGAGVILEHDRLPDGRYQLLLHGTDRVRLLAELPPDQSFRLARVERVADLPEVQVDQGPQLTLRQLVLQLVEAVPDVRAPLSEIIGREQTCTCLAGELACRLIPDPELRQQLLEERDPNARVRGIQAAIAEIFLRLKGGGDDPDATLN